MLSVMCAGVTATLCNEDMRLVLCPQAIAEAVQSAVAGKQQVVEPDHLAKALLEQPNGLARRIVVKVKKTHLFSTAPGRSDEEVSAAAPRLFDSDTCRDSAVPVS